MFGTYSGLISEMAQNISGDHQLGIRSKQVIILIENSLEISIKKYYFVIFVC